MSERPQSGTEYAQLIAAYLAKNYGPRGLVVYREVSLGKSIIGKNRRIDVFVVHEESDRVLAVECKWQSVSGTADEKIPYTLADLAAMHVPAFVTYAGDGFSQGVLHMLQASPLAAYCLPNADLTPSDATLELDHIVATTFGFWGAVLRKKQPFDLGAWEAARERAAAFQALEAPLAEPPIVATPLVVVEDTSSLGPAADEIADESSEAAPLRSVE